MPASPSEAVEWIAYNLFNAVWINALLAVFNMLPVPPLDGGRVAVGLLPAALARPLSRVEPFGFFIILGVVFLLPLLGDWLGFDLRVMEWLVIGPAEWLSRRHLQGDGGGMNEARPLAREAAAEELAPARR